MIFKLEVRTDNAAFDNNGEELALILKWAARDAYDAADSGILRDSNGNTVGRWHWQREGGVYD